MKKKIKLGDMYYRLLEALSFKSHAQQRQRWRHHKSVQSNAFCMNHHTNVNIQLHQLFTNAYFVCLQLKIPEEKQLKNKNYVEFDASE